MRHLKPITLAGLAVVLCFSTVTSQEPRSRRTASEFNIEILNLGVRPHVFSIPVPPARNGYYAHMELKRVPDWKASGEVPVEASALRLEFYLEGGVPWIEITGYLGKIEPHSSRPSEWGTLGTAKVVSRALPPEETITIAETERFGIVPFQVRAFRAAPWSVGPPQITNKTQALTAFAITEERPSYTLSVRNVSHKLITAIQWYGVENGRRTGGSGMSGGPIIPAGRSFEIRLWFGFTEDKARPEAADKEPATKREIVIAAIVFDDGTFEGEADEAAEMAASMTGGRIQHFRVNRLLRNISAATGNEQAQVLKNLKRDITALSEEVDAGLVVELRSRFAEASEDMRNRRIKEEVANGLRFVKNDLLSEIEKFEYRREHSPADVDFEVWLKEALEHSGRKRTN